MWLSIPRRWSSSYFVICAEETPDSARPAAALANSDHLSKVLRIEDPSLEVEVKSQQQFAAVQILAGLRAGPVLVQPVVFVVPGEARPAGHKGVVAVADGVGGDVAK